MKILLVGINAKYSHSNLALDYIKSYCMDYKLETVEFNINQPMETIYSEILDKNADVIGFSAYIWNIQFIEMISSDLKKANPKLTIIWGGPEVSFDTVEIMEKNKSVDIIIRGEGEATARELIHALDNDLNLVDIKGISYRDNENIYVNDERELIEDLDTIPSPFVNFHAPTGRIVYYEVSRGCPFKCAYCLSSTIRGVRYFSEERIKSDLISIINSCAKVVKLVDRTFNSNEAASIEIMKFIMDNATEGMCFHMELMAHLITDNFLEFLKTVPKGLFQFEIGIQSSNQKTLKEISRATNLDRLARTVKTIKSFDKTHQHVDLIAGLPYEDMESFKESFNYAYSLGAEKLQLGFLKLLKGSSLRHKAQELGIIYSDYPPYEVIKTKWMSPRELYDLKLVEDVVEKYSNEDYFENTLNKFVGESPFEFFSDFGKFWKEKGYHLMSHRRVDLYEKLHEFLKESYDETEFVEHLRLDFLINQNINPPKYLNPMGIEMKYYHEILKDEGVREIFGVSLGIPTKKLVNSFRFEKFHFSDDMEIYGIYYSTMGNIKVNITKEVERILNGLYK